jgi:hypothetical protein
VTQVYCKQQYHLRWAGITTCSFVPELFGLNFGAGIRVKTRKKVFHSQNACGDLKSYLICAK